MKRYKSIILISIFLILITALTITVRAYFTTYAEASGEKQLEISDCSCKILKQGNGNIRNISVQK